MNASMENVQGAAGETMAPTDMPSVQTPNTGNVASAMSTMAPAVQQFMTLAQDHTGVSDQSHISDSSITAPEFSSITARNVQLDYRNNAAAARAPQTNNNIGGRKDTVRLIQEDFARRIQSLQLQMQQEIGRTLNSQAASQANPTGQVRRRPSHSGGGLLSSVRPPLVIYLNNNHNATFPN